MRDMSSQNPLTVGLSRTALPQPCTLVIFGASGDLARRKLLPAIYNLALDGVLPANIAVVGFSRTEYDDQQFRGLAQESIEKYSRRPLDAEHWPDVERSIFYVPGSPNDLESYRRLEQRLGEIDAARGIPGNRIFYLSVPPSVFDGAISHLHDSGMVRPPDEAPFSRIIIEKPIGYDLQSARKVNDTLASAFDERQIFRIDHYLGKETVQNILVMRFANSIFEPLWNHKYVDHVQITVAEEEGVGSRAHYYDGAGALRDMVQNHILQLVCMTAMEPPWEMQADVVRDHKLEVLQCLRPIAGEDVGRNVVRAQYVAGVHRGIEASGYRQEKDVNPQSTTETYVALRLFIDNWRWAGVPFFLRTGKRLPKRASEIAVQFKDVPPILFNNDPAAPLEANVLALRIQPDEGLSLRISTKLPGQRVRIYPVKMDFRYGSTFGDTSPEAYERLLLDVMAGDATLFMRRDAVETSWRWVTDILEAWKRASVSDLPQYPAGTWGPEPADRLIGDCGRQWRTL